MPKRMVAVGNGADPANALGENRCIQRVAIFQQNFESPEKGAGASRINDGSLVDRDFDFHETLDPGDRVHDFNRRHIW